MQTQPGIRCKRNGIVPVAGLWDFDGACQPKLISGVSTSTHGYHSFSVGVFQWIAKSSGKGLKRSKSIKRFSGSVNDYEMVYAKAELFCIDKDLEQ